MTFEIPIIIDEDILNQIPETQNKHIRFLLFWLQERTTKAVVLKSSWYKFCKSKEDELENGEAKTAYFQFIRGIVRYHFELRLFGVSAPLRHIYDLFIRFVNLY